MKKLYYILIIGIIALLVITCTKRPLPDVYQQSDTPVNPVTPNDTITKATVVTGDVTDITMTSVLVSGTVTDDGGDTLTERGVCWSLSQNPNIDGNHASNGTGVGNYTVNITELSSDTMYYVRAYATNTAGTSYGEEVSFRTLNEPTKPVVTTGEVTDITTTTVKISGSVVSDGGATVTEFGVCWSHMTNPSISSSHIQSSGNNMSDFTVNVSGLTANVKYYARAYAKNSVGVGYGNIVTFVTNTEVSVPTVTTNDVTGITQTTAVCGGTVVSNGGADITAKGVCWSTDQNPTISDEHTSNGEGNGAFTSSLTNLSPNTTYYVRAYATNSEGTAYGSQVSFVTKSYSAPTVITHSISNITETSALCGGNVTDNGGMTVTSRGVCWSTSQNPTINDSHTLDGSGLGTFTSDITGLSPNTTYYVRAYATNSAGIGYGTQKTFTTSGGGTVPTGAIDGQFSVSATQQVYFSKGNLRYQASTDTWKFADNQYDIVGESNSYMSSSYSGWIDLFGCGTSGYNHGAVCYQPWSTSTNNSDYYAYGSPTYNLYDQTGKADWGYNQISNGGNTENQWRTLKNAEWIYVFNTRNTNSGIRFAKAVVNGINGVILLPDDWNSSYYGLNNTNSGDSSFNSNVISSSQWTSNLEAHGAVFLPAGGWRGGSSAYDNGVCYYWSSSRSNNDCLYGVYIPDDQFYPSDSGCDRMDGRSVRLVKDAN